MIPASKATLARTMPGPPRAFVVIARLSKSKPRNPANRPANDTERILTTQLPIMKAAVIPSDRPRTRSSFNPTIAKYAGIKNANDTFPMASSAFREQSALLVHHGEPGKKGRKYYADIQRSSHHAIPEEHRNRIRHRRVLDENVEP